MMESGFVVIHRKIINTAIYNNPKLLHLFIHCIIRANHMKRDILISGQLLELNAGQFVTSRRALAKETGQSEYVVYRGLKALEKFDYIRVASTSQFTLITVNNYDLYQQTEKAAQQPHKVLHNEGLKSHKQLHKQPHNEEENKRNNNNKLEHLAEEVAQAPHKQSHNEGLKSHNEPHTDNNSINNIIIMSPDEEEVIRSLARVPGYPLERNTDLELFHDLEKDYPKADVVEAIKSWSIAKIDKPLPEIFKALLQPVPDLKPGV